MSKIEDLEKILDQLGLTEYERKIYIALYTSGPLTASEVGDITGIPKFNVYPTLKRLVLKKFLDDQPVSRGSKYKPVPPSKVIQDLQAELKIQQEKEQANLKEIATRISKFDFAEDELIGASPSDAIWLINSEVRIKKAILELLVKAEKSLIICLPLTLEIREEVLKALQKLSKKKGSKFQLFLNWELQEGTEDEKIAKVIANNGGNVYQWGIGELPFSAFLIDNTEGLIILQSVWIPHPKFGLALWLRHPSYLHPFEKLIERFGESGIFRKWS